MPGACLREPAIARMSRTSWSGRGGGMPAGGLTHHAVEAAASAHHAGRRRHETHVRKREVRGDVGSALAVRGLACPGSECAVGARSSIGRWSDDPRQTSASSTRARWHVPLRGCGRQEKDAKASHIDPAANGIH